MNTTKILKYIELYKEHFQEIHLMEIYKWEAVKQFQDNFNIDSKDLAENILLSLSKTDNLLQHKVYKPRTMLYQNAQRNPSIIRMLLIELFDDNEGLAKRIQHFMIEMKVVNEKNFPGTKAFQDHRAVSVYLTLMFPERYFLYKYGMFKDFAQKVDYAYTPISGRDENVFQYINLCKLVNHYIAQDQELIWLHESRLNSDCYRDIHFHILTQDFIYAVVKHLPNIAESKVIDPNAIPIENVESSLDVEISNENLNFTPVIVDYIEQAKENSRIGILGELFVINREREKLKAANKTKFAKKVRHVSVEQGDGLGYDILSFDVNGNEKHIEVKTTKGPVSNPIFITRNELSV